MQEVERDAKLEQTRLAPLLDELHQFRAEEEEWRSKPQIAHGKTETEPKREVQFQVAAGYHQIQTAQDCTQDCIVDRNAADYFLRKERVIKLQLAVSEAERRLVRTGEISYYAGS